MGIFNWKKKSRLPVMTFETGEAFVDYHCKYMNTRLQVGSPLAAVVLDAMQRVGVPVAVKVDEDGNQMAMLRVASDDGCFVVLAQTASGKGDRLVPGDAVAWIPGQYLSGVGASSNDERSGWVGLIVAKIAPEIDENTKQMRVLSRY